MKTKYWWIEYVLWAVFTLILAAVISFVWYLSFSVPIGVEVPIQWMIQNKTVTFAFFIVFSAATLAMFLAVIFYSNFTINLESPFNFNGIIILSITVLLLSVFFSENSPNSSSRFYDTHPLIFYTTAALIGLGIIASIATNIKMHKIQGIPIHNIKRL